MRSFEEDDAFVEVFAKGPGVHQRWGRRGHEGHRRVDVCATTLEAAQVFTGRVNALSQRYRIGSQQHALLSAMHATPGDPTPFLVYGDWLQQHGDPHGMVIANSTRRCETSGLISAEDTPHFIPRSFFRRTETRIEWELGFIVRCEVSMACADQIDALFRHHAMGFVRRLFFSDLVEVDDPDRWVHLLNTRAPPTLERIEVKQKSALVPLASKIPKLRVVVRR